MWDLNDNLNIQTIQIQDTLAYIIDDFYKDPDKLARFIFGRELPLHKDQVCWAGKNLSRNGIDFEDKRLSIGEQYTPAHKFLQELCGQNFLYNNPHISTNQIKFLDNDYNNRFSDHVWWAHSDAGYNGIVYFNKTDEINGTNLYATDSEPPKYEEHIDPWKPKEEYKIIHSFKPKFNRCVFFDGFKFPHGMAINDKQYHCKSLTRSHWETYRTNQVFFFETKPHFF